MSAAPKFTPGPWTLMAGMPTNVLNLGGLRVARCDFDGDFNSVNAHANARLIAAAPDLYAALTCILNRYVELVDCGNCGWDIEKEREVTAAIDALAKVDE